MLLANLPKHVALHSLEVNTKRTTPQFVAHWPAHSDRNRELAVESVESSIPSIDELPSRLRRFRHPDGVGLQLLFVFGGRELCDL